MSNTICAEPPLKSAQCAEKPVFCGASPIRLENIPPHIPLLFMPDVTSTNTWLEARWRELPPFTTLYCNTQSAGKGRLDRPWLSDSTSNLYVSILFKPVDSPFPSVNMTQFASIALCQTMALWGISAQIKWPNDVLIDGTKVAGILSRLVVDEGMPKALILGIGVNIRAEQSFLERVQNLGKSATSLHLHANKPITREGFLASFLTLFMEQYPNFVQQGFATLRSSYLDLATHCNQRVTIDHSGSRLTGIIKTVTNEGALIVEDAMGIQHIITVGEIS